MLEPGTDTTRVILVVALVGWVTLMVVRAVLRNRNDLARFKRARSPKRRVATYRRWLVQSVAVFGGGSAVLVALTWQHIQPLFAEVAGWPVVVWWHGVESPLIWVMATAAVLGILLLPMFFVRGEDEVATVGDISALLPRSRPELPWAAALGVSAGVFEETMFRLALPLVLFGITDDAVLAFGVSVLVFAALHFYQGVWGILASLLMGVVFTGLVVFTGSLLTAIVLHTLIDIRSLVLIPMVVMEVHLPRSKRRSTIRHREAAAAARAEAARERALRPFETGAERPPQGEQAQGPEGAQSEEAAGS